VLRSYAGLKITPNQWTPPQAYLPTFPPPADALYSWNTALQSQQGLSGGATSKLITEQLGGYGKFASAQLIVEPRLRVLNIPSATDDGDAYDKGIAFGELYADLNGILRRRTTLNAQAYTMTASGFLRKATNLEYLNAGPAFSCEGWVKTLGHTDVVSYVACTSVSSQCYWYLALATSSGSSTFNLKCVVENGSGVLFSATHPAAIDNGWHHLCFAKLTATTGALYVDGVASVIGSFGAAASFMQAQGAYNLYSGFNAKTGLAGSDFTVSQLRLTLGFPYAQSGFTPPIDIQGLTNDICFLGSACKDIAINPVGSATWSAQNTVTLGRRM
jgi:hypothetical protein